MIDLDAVVQATHELAPLPASVTRLSGLVTQSDVDLREVADVVALDQALTARLLRSANSAMSGSRQPVKTVKDAVVRLGSGLVLSFAIATTVRREMQREIKEYGFGEGDLWRRSVASALAAECIKEFAKAVRVPPETFTAALLHEVGRLVLCRFLKQDVVEVLEEARSTSDLSECEAESKVLGVNHAELGALVARRWMLPETIVHAIQYFARPKDGSDRLKGYEDPRDDSLMDVVCDTVHVAHAVAEAMLATHGREDAEPQPPACDPGATERLGLDAESLERIRAAVEERFDKVLASYG